MVRMVISHGEIALGFGAHHGHRVCKLRYNNINFFYDIFLTKIVIEGIVTKIIIVVE